MNVGGRWMPMEVVDVLLVLWVILVMAATALIFFLRRPRRRKEIKAASATDHQHKCKRRKRVS